MSNITGGSFSSSGNIINGDQDDDQQHPKTLINNGTSSSQQSQQTPPPAPPPPSPAVKKKRNLPGTPGMSLAFSFLFVLLLHHHLNNTYFDYLNMVKYRQIKCLKIYKYKINISTYLCS